MGLGGYLGKTKTLDLFNKQYYWKGIADDVRKYVARYLFCIKTKFPKLLSAGLLKLLLLLLKPWAKISVNYIIFLPFCKRQGREFKYIAVVVDRLTKIRHFLLIEILELGELADRFVKRVYSLYGAPETIVLDKGIQFVLTF